MREILRPTTPVPGPLVPVHLRPIKISKEDLAIIILTQASLPFPCIAVELELGASLGARAVRLPEG